MILIFGENVRPWSDELALQHDALGRAGCYRIYSESVSGALADRPQLAAALDVLRPGDTLVVWRLDRLGRSLRHLIDTVHELDERKVGFRSLQESIDTTTSAGQLVFHVFAALAEFERNLVRDRTMAGLQAARDRGRVGGRPTTMTPDKFKAARRMQADGTPVAEIARLSASAGRPSTGTYRARALMCNTPRGSHRFGGGRAVIT